MRHNTAVSPPFYLGNLEQDTLDNTDYKRELHWTQQQQLFVMNITPADGGIEREIHEAGTQFIRIEAGSAWVTVNGARRRVSDGFAVTIGPGVEHEVEVIGDKPLKLYTIYSPPQHSRGTVLARRTR